MAPADRRRNRLRRWPGFALAVAVLAATPLHAQFVSIPFGGPRPVRPSPNATLLGAPADIAAAVAANGRPAAMVRLDDSRHPVEVLGFLGLFRGARVVDIESDTGYYAEIMGTAIRPNGTITEFIRPAVSKDLASRELLSGIIGRVPSLSLVAVEPGAVPLAPSSTDFVLMQLTLHEIYGRSDGADSGRTAVRAYVRKLFNAVRPGGIVGIIDYVALAGDDVRAAANLGRIDPLVVKADFLGEGFVLDSESNVLRRNDGDHAQPVAVPDSDSVGDRFVFRFRKPEP